MSHIFSRETVIKKRLFLASKNTKTQIKRKKTSPWTDHPMLRFAWLIWPWTVAKKGIYMILICGLLTINIKDNDIKALRWIINLVVKSFPTTKVQLGQQYLTCSTHWLLILNFCFVRLLACKGTFAQFEYWVIALLLYIPLGMISLDYATKLWIYLYLNLVECQMNKRRCCASFLGLNEVIFRVFAPFSQRSAREWPWNALIGKSENIRIMVDLVPGQN